MRPSLNSASVVLLVLLLFPPKDDFAESTDASPGADVILEVIETNSTLASEDAYLYLRVFSDGTAECHSVVNGEKKEIRSFKKTLTQDEFTQVKSVVGNPKLARVKPKYETRYAIVDTYTEWKITIQRRGQSQVIHILEFSPGLAKIMKHPYPEALVKLGCSARKLRDDVLGQPSYFDSECRRVLGISQNRNPSLVFPNTLNLPAFASTIQ